jgi:hypothetical protein
VFLNAISSSRKDEKMCEVTQELGSKKCRSWMQMWTEQRLGVRLTAEELDMNMETVRRIIAEDLGARADFAKMMPRMLTDDHISSDLLHNAEKFGKAVTGEET